jgi:hypothetical protein
MRISGISVYCVRPQCIPNWLLGAEPPPIDNPVSQVLVGRFQVIVDDDLIMTPRLAGELELIPGLLQPLAQALVGLRAPPTQPRLQLLQRRRRKEEEPRIEIRPLDLFHALHT